MNNETYLMTHIRGISDDFARIMLTTQKGRSRCDAAMGEGTYENTLVAADKIFPEGFLIEHYVKEITDPYTRRLSAPAVVAFPDWVVALTQITCEGFAKDANPSDADIVEHFRKLMTTPRDERTDPQRPNS